MNENVNVSRKMNFNFVTVVVSSYLVVCRERSNCQ